MITAIDSLPDMDLGGDVTVLGAERRRVSDAFGEAYSPGIREVHRTHWAKWIEWASGHRIRTLPAAPVHVATFLTDRAEECCRPATLHAALSATVFAHGAERLDSPTEDERARHNHEGLSRILGRGQRQAPGLVDITLVSARYEKGSNIPTQNKGFADKGELLGDTVMATTILDRLLHRSQVVNFRGESYRLKDKRQAGILTSTPEEIQMER